MKNLILVSVLVISTLFNVQANNSPTSATVFTVSGEKSVILNLADIFSQTDLFTITDSNDNIVFTDIVEKYKNNVKYNLRNLPNGEYTINIEGENFTEYYETSITNDQVKIVSSQSYFKPVIHNMNTSIVISDANSTSKEDVQVYIYNEDGDLVYDFKDTKIGTYTKKFNLEHLQKGNYNMIVYTDHFTESINISL